MNPRHQRRRQPPQGHKLPQALGRDRNVGNFPRDCRARVDCNADIRLGQRGRIVHAVPNHNHRMPLGARTADILRLILRQNLRAELVHADLRRHSRRGCAVIARHHDGMRNAAFMQGADNLPRLRTERVGHTDDRRERSRNAEVQMRIFGRQRSEFFLLARGDRTALVLKDEMCAPDDDLFPVDTAGNAVRHHILHAGVVFLMVQPARLCLVDHRIRHGVRVVLLKAGGKAEHFVLVPTAEGHNLRHTRRGIGQGSRLVKDHRVGIRNRLKEAPALDGEVMRMPFPHGGKHRDGHGELQRAGEVHHQHRKHFGHVAGQEPCQPRSEEGVRDQTVRQPCRLVLGGGFQLFGFLNHAHDAIVATLAHDLRNPHHAFALLHNRPGVNVASAVLRNRQRFARHACLIDRCLSVGHGSVQRNEVSGANHNQVARPHLADRNGFLAVVGYKPDLIHAERHRACEISHRFLVCPVLKQLAQTEHEHHRPRRGEVPAQERHADCGCIQCFNSQLSFTER